MKIKFLQGLDKDEAIEIKQSFIEASKLRKHLVSVLEREINSLHIDMRAEANFGNPNWPYFQADRLGQEKAFLQIISFLKSDDS